MNVVDIIFVIPLAYLCYKGFRKGFVIEVFSLLALLFGIYCAIHFSGFTYKTLSEKLNSNNLKTYLPLISYALTFILAVILVHLIGKLIEKTIDFASLTTLNKVLGAFFGILKGVLIICALLMFFNPLNDQWNLIDKTYLKDSLLYEPISGIIIELGPQLEQNETFRQIKEGFNALLPTQP